MAGYATLTAERIIETLGGQRALKTRVLSLDDLRARLRTGLPYESLSALSVGYGIEVQDLSAILAIPMRTLARRKKEKRLHADESDRLFRVGRIAALAEQTLGSKDKAKRWLQKANRALGGAAPLRLLDTELGARQVEDVLGRIAHGVYS
jgi:putative toxin-antitoxin system antitoxin component (TIGR02293 family)